MARYKLTRYEVEVDRELPGPHLVGQLTSNINEVRDLALQLIPDDDREHFIVLMLSSQNRVMGYYHAATGTGTTVTVHPGEVMRVALLCGARRMVVVHNHPAGSTKPSDDDLHLTRRLSQAASLLGMVVLDHVIVSHEKPDWSWSATHELKLTRPVRKLRAHEAAPWPEGIA
jgi:DNA repair protein RadC